MANMTRCHNDSNVLAMGARTTDLETMKKIIDAFINGKFEGDRHIDRINTILDYEVGCSNC